MKTCVDCLQEFEPKPYDLGVVCPPCRRARGRTKACRCGTMIRPESEMCRPCRDANPAPRLSGDKHPHWKGGRSVRNGYVFVLQNGLHVGEHRVVMEKKLGRSLLPHESVHHVNGDRSDNRIENLELWSSSQPYGQRVSDKLEWAREIIRLYG